MILLALGGCSWGVHDAQKAECQPAQVACGVRCLAAGEVCRLGMTVMASHLEGQGPGIDVLIVKTVAVGSPAEVAGLRPGDAITKIDEAAPTEQNLEAALAAEEKAPVRLFFLRQGYALKTDVEINRRRR